MRYRYHLLIFIIVVTVLCFLMVSCASGENPANTETGNIADDSETGNDAEPQGTDKDSETMPVNDSDVESDEPPVETEPETETMPDTEPEPIPEPEPEVDRRAEHIYEAHPELTPVNYDSPSLLPISEDMGMDYLDQFTFLCESPTYWIWPYGLLKDGEETKKVWTGPEGTCTLAFLEGYEIRDPYDGGLRTIPEAIALHKPDHVIIALGLNGIAFMDEEWFTQEYEDLLNDIWANSPDTVIVLMSMYPVSKAYSDQGMITNSMITAGNSWILKIAEKYGLGYIDAYSCLLGEDGNAIESLIKPDGFHPNYDGLVLILDYIRTHALIED